MHLQLMKYKHDGRIQKVICAIDLYVHGFGNKTGLKAASKGCLWLFLSSLNNHAEKPL